ncbi:MULTISPECIES: phytoene desaturase family protein [Microbacterium]|uniref:phytoene desaturase family protein n=1 Tax=Microbacterium TaxID=33882 RepID=UPI0022855A3A|nr:MULTISPECIES: phytoene desaturase family protein [Microbacterium]MCZ0709519.1 phytoene desaturase family protein [Microbacterium paraoxydans]MDH5133072.1 phytoene desaturase family protein [Microbacterium sp. RD10]MDH5136569.1 phytoene desaturase family protein [Microbacterium sp. RD11]MDH5144597.1 phytoene desaturase family protein [Microbacterium sp. RD12]MDH5154612.1 phytoene desaturase family protein [Microbacterium sp. RD06]
MSRVVVIGAGVAGLATAGLLARDGHDVVVLEKNDRVGGRAGTIERDGFRFDSGPSWYLMPEVFDHYFAMMGTSTEEQLDLTLLDPGYRVFRSPESGDDPVTVPAGREAVSALFESMEPGSAAALETYLASAHDAGSMARRYFLYNPFTRTRTLAAPEVVRALPRLFSLLGTRLQAFAARRFRHPVLRQILGYPAVFLGTDPRTAPAMYHLMSALDLDQGVLYPQGGFWRVVERLATLAQDAGARIVTGAEVTGIRTQDADGATHVTGVGWTDRDGHQHVEDADFVVSGADLHHTETALLPPTLQSYPESWWARRTSGPGGVLVMLGVRGTLPELPHHSLFFTDDWDANFDAIFGRTPGVPTPASTYVCRPSATDAGVAPDGHENLFVLIPVPADVELGHGGSDGAGSPKVEKAADAAIDMIAAWSGIPDLRERIVVRETVGPADFRDDYHSWRGGMLGPAHILSQSAMFRAQNASRRVRGLYYAGATTAPGVGVPMCLISAEIVLKRIRGDHSPGPLPEPATRTPTPEKA